MRSSTAIGLPWCARESSSLFTIPLPFVSVSPYLSCSTSTSFSISSLFSLRSGKSFENWSTCIATISESLPWRPSWDISLRDRLTSSLAKYPCLTFDGTTPSLSMNMSALVWSHMT